MNKKYDVIIVGAGIGGYMTAIKSAQSGFKTLIVEKEYFGGVCLNVGCIPTKALLKSSKTFDMFKHASDMGIDLADPNSIKPNWSMMQKRKNQVISKLVNGVQYLLKKNKVDVIKGEAIPVDKNTIKVKNEVYSTNNLIIATGSLPRHLPLPGFETHRKSGFLLDSTTALSLKSIPKHLIIIGGGVIGIEFAFMFSELGSQVTIVEGLPFILNPLDLDVRKEIAKVLQHKKIKVFTKASVKEIKNNQIIFLDENNKSQTIKGDFCLESVGRVPYVSGFDRVGIKLNKQHQIITDEYFKTNIDNVFAIGDVNGKSMLAHSASAQGLMVIYNLKNPNKKYTINSNRIPNCIYSHPSVGSVGITEQDAIEKKLEYTKFVFPMTAIGKAIADGDTKGFVKILITKKYKEIIGAHIVCETATDMISEITAVMECEGTIDEVALTIHPHPTLSEAVGETAHALKDNKPISM